MRLVLAIVAAAGMALGTVTAVGAFRGDYPPSAPVQGCDTWANPLCESAARTASLP